MSKCTSCRQQEVKPTKWEVFRYKVMFYLFGEDLGNLIQEKYTQGFGDGYKYGFEACRSMEITKDQIMEEVVKKDGGFSITPYEEK